MTSLIDALVSADDAASEAHEHLWTIEHATFEERRSAMDAAIWKIHHALRPLIDPTGETWIKER
jgi:hypothetical protein